LGEYPSGNDLPTLVANIKKAMNSAIKDIPLSASVFEVLEFDDPKVDLYDDIFRSEISSIVTESFDTLVENKQIKNVENTRNEVITTIDKINFIITYEHDIQISGLTYTKSILSGFNGTTFYNQFKPAITYLKSANEQHISVLEPTINPNFTGTTLSFDTEDLKSILSILLIDKKDRITQYFEDPDDFRNVSTMLNQFIYQDPNQLNSTTFNLGVFPTKPNDKPIEFVISSTVDMTDDAEGLVANNIFINKNKLGTTLNFYKP
jgi:hypothetical protein